MRVGFRKDKDIEIAPGLNKTIKKGRIYRCTPEKALEITASAPGDFICVPDDQWTNQKRRDVLLELNQEETTDPKEEEE